MHILKQLKLLSPLTVLFNCTFVEDLGHDKDPPTSVIHEELLERLLEKDTSSTFYVFFYNYTGLKWMFYNYCQEKGIKKTLCIVCHIWRICRAVKSCGCYQAVAKTQTSIGTVEAAVLNMT